ncbi:MAG: prephenate dehydrogenase [Nitratiruptor sp.]|nr:prephenate dehydrogenase [Nitratiruptor sp.]NPA82850.1 prephenate dehydrogenase [Campylobacterota bacterium]
MVVGIVGLGLMGGSLALDLRRFALAQEILGYDRNEEHAKTAQELGLVDRIVPLEELKRADVIFLAIPVEGIIKLFPTFKDIDPQTTLIDLGSTKAKIIQACPPEIRSNFVPAHPMTGTEYSGPLAAIEGLYHGKIVVLCDIEASGELHKERAKELFEAIGMEIVYMEAKEHDLHAAYISHLPHAISYALANSVLKQEDPKSILVLAAGGFKDMSRLAKSNPDMWVDIFKQNREHLLEAMEVFKRELRQALELIEEERWEELRTWMARATTLHKIL